MISPHIHESFYDAIVSQVQRGTSMDEILVYAHYDLKELPDLVELLGLTVIRHRNRNLKGLAIARRIGEA